MTLDDHVPVLLLRALRLLGLSAGPEAALAAVEVGPAARPVGADGRLSGKQQQGDGLRLASGMERA